MTQRAVAFETIYITRHDIFPQAYKKEGYNTTMKMRMIILAVLVMAMLTACATRDEAPDGLPDEVQDWVQDESGDASQDGSGDGLQDEVQEGDDGQGAGGADAEEADQPLFSESLPEEFMAFFKGHEMSGDDNPVIGTYVTTSGCIMILLQGGLYAWQDSQDGEKTPAIGGRYEIFEGTLYGETGEYVFESDTGPLYTVIVTFDGGQNAAPGTIQVFDYYNEDMYRVTDIMNNIWFEATRIL